MTLEEAIEVARRELREGMASYEDGDDADDVKAQECRDALAMIGRVAASPPVDAGTRLEGQLDRLEALLAREEQPSGVGP